MLSILPVVLAASLSFPTTPLSTEALLTSPTRHVRTTDGIMQRFIRYGLERSPTLHALMARLDATDVIVYVEPATVMPKTLAGRLMLVPFGGQQRYLRIQIALGGTPTDTIAILGHELRHALEVAEARDVFDQAGLAALYRRIGDNAHRGKHLYDTTAAREIGRIVQRELSA
jgi:hypothetical protein